MLQFICTPNVRSPTLLSPGSRFLADRSASREKAVLKTCQDSFLLLEEADGRPLLPLLVLVLLQGRLPDQLQFWSGVAHVSDFFKHLQQSRVVPVLQAVQVLVLMSITGKTLFGGFYHQGCGFRMLCVASAYADRSLMIIWCVHSPESTSLPS